MNMLRPIIVAFIFNAFSTKCYEEPMWNNLVVLKKAIPQDAETLPPLKRMAPTPYSRYEIQPGGLGMFTDIAQGIQARMRGIAKGPFLVVFDYGGIAPKYFSIIEDIASGSPVKVGPLGRVIIEPPGIAQQFMTADDRITPVQHGVGNTLGAQIYLEPTASAVPVIQETIPQMSVSIPNGGSQLKRILAKPSAASLEKTIEISTEKAPALNLHDDNSLPGNGIAPMGNQIKQKPVDALNTIAPPISIDVTLEPSTAERNSPSTAASLSPIGGEQMGPAAIESSLNGVDASDKHHNGLKLDMPLKGIYDGETTIKPAAGGILPDDGKGSLLNGPPATEFSVNGVDAPEKGIYDGETAINPDSGGIPPEGERSLPNGPAAINGRLESSMNGLDASDKAPYGLKLGIPLEGIYDGKTAIKPAGGGIPPVMERIVTNPSSALTDNNSPSSIAVTKESINNGENNPLDTDTVAAIGGEHSTTNATNAEEDVITPQRIEMEALVTTLPSSAEPSTVDTSAKTPVIILEDDSLLNDSLNSSATSLPINSSESSTVDTNFNTTNSGYNNEASTNDGEESPLKIDANPSTNLPLPSINTSTVQITMGVPVSITNYDSSNNYGVTSNPGNIYARPSTIESTIENIAVAPDEIAAMIGSKNAEGNASLTKNLPFLIEGERRLLNKPNTNESHDVSSLDMESGKDPFDIGLRELKSIDAEPSIVTLPTLRIDTSTVVPKSNPVISTPNYESTTNEGETSAPMGTEAKDSVNPTQPTTNKTIVKPNLSSAKDYSLQNGGVLLTPRSVVSVATPTTDSIREIVLETPVSILEEYASEKDAVKPSQKGIAAEHSMPTREQANAAAGEKTPLGILDENGSSSGGEIVSILTPTLEPSNAFKATATLSSTAATRESIINVEEFIQSPLKTVTSIEGKQPLLSKPNSTETFVEVVHVASGQGPSTVELIDLKNIESKPSSAVPQRVSTVVDTPDTFLNDNDTYPGGGITSTAKVIMTHPSSALKDIVLPRSTSVTRAPITAERNIPLTANKVVPIETEHSLLYETNTIEPPVRTTVGTDDDSTGIGLGTSLLKGIADGVRTSIVSAGSGIASMMKMIMPISSSVLMNSSLPNSTAEKIESVNVEINVPPTTDTFGPNSWPMEGERSLPYELTTNTLELLPDQSGKGLSKLQSSEVEPPAITLSTFTIYSPDVDKNLNKVVSENATANNMELSTPNSIMANPVGGVKTITSPSSTAVTLKTVNVEGKIQSTTETIVSTGEGNYLPDDIQPSPKAGNEASSTDPSSKVESSQAKYLPDEPNVIQFSLKTGDGASVTDPFSNLGRIEATPSAIPLPTPTIDPPTLGTNGKAFLLIPKDDSLANDGVASTLESIAAKTPTVALDFVSADENVVSTTNTDVPTKGGQSVPNATESSVKAVDMISGNDSSDTGLGTALLKGITDGVTTSLASAGSGIASMMNFILPASSVRDTSASPSSTTSTVEPANPKESIPSSSNTVLTIGGERSLLNAPANESHTGTTDWESGKDPSDIGLSKSLLKGIADGVKNGLDGVKAIEFPGKSSIALLYPDQNVSIADKSTNEIVHFTPLANVAVNAGDAQALYIGLKPVTKEVSFIIKTRGFNCVPLKLTKLNLNLYVVDSIVFGEGHICGLENMKPGNMVTITKDDEHVMEVTMPLVLKDLTVKIKSVDISNYLFTIVKGQPIEATVKEISCKGTFSFRKGTLFELTSFRMEWGDITGVHFKLEGALEEGGPVSGMIDSIADALSGLIKLFVSPILDEIEKQITKSILGS